MKQVLENDYFTVVLSADQKVIEIRRSVVPFRALPHFVAALDEVLHAIGDLPTSEYCLLYDARHSPRPGGNTYMKAFSRMAQELTSRFGPVVVIARDKEMMLQARQYHLPKVHIFTNEGAARKVLGELAETRSRP